jgi:predicted acylesterase/phospholipase RssA
MWGAYAVGVLNGWTAKGDRPRFDVVTGVSTGGLMGTFAFLGPEYNQRLVELYTSVRKRDIYRRRPVFALLWSDAFASSAPLKRIIDTEITDEVLQAVAAEHAVGRRLYIGTSDVDTGRLVVWDMGAIASSGRPDAKKLYRDIVLATSSIPGLLPPVPVTIDVNGRCYTELHVDGGATSMLFLRASELTADKDAVRAGRQPLAGSDVYVILSSKLYKEPQCTRRTTPQIGAATLDSLLYSQTRGELFRINAMCLLSGMRFHLTAIPQDHPLGEASMKLGPNDMRRLYEVGYGHGLTGQSWRDSAPMDEPAEHLPVRGGTEFIGPGATGAGEGKQPIDVEWRTGDGN